MSKDNKKRLSIYDYIHSNYLIYSLLYGIVIQNGTVSFYVIIIFLDRTDKMQL
jgi:hypothetical protein